MSSGGKHQADASPSVSETAKLAGDVSDLARDEQLWQTPRIEALIDRLRKCVHAKKFKAKPDEVEDIGIQLWNSCNRLKRESGGHALAPAIAKLALLGRALAFFLITNLWTRAAPVDRTIYVLKLALKAGRSLAEDAENDIAAQVMKMATDFKDHLVTLKPTLGDGDAREAQGLEAEYFIIRTVLTTSLTPPRFDLAEHMYTKAGPVLDNLLPDSAEALADVLLGISKSLAAQDDFALAVTWLDRAKSIIDGQDLERLSREAVELKLAINQALVTALISLPNATGIDRAEDVLRELETLGSPLVVLLLRLEVIQRKPAENFDDATYASLIRALLKTVKSPEGGGEQSASRLMQLIHHHIRKLHQKSPSLGCRLQDELIDSVRTVKDDCWLEKMIVFRFWMASQQRTAEDTIRELSEILTRLDQPLSPEAAMSVQALVSAKLEGEGEPAGPWCALALHPRLEKSGPANMQKLENRLLLDAISRGDMDAAMAVVHERGLMDRAKTDAMACYLIFKVALRTQDHGLAVECIEILGSGPQQQEYLSACVADAQQCGNGAVAVASMKELVERFEYQASTSLHLPALLRCMIRILHGLMEAEQTELGRSRISEDVVLAFDAVLCAIEKHPSLFDAREINWFSRTAYNLGLQSTKGWSQLHTVQLLSACVGLNQRCTSISSPRSTCDLALKSLFSHFLIASTLLSLARVEEHAEQRLQHYLNVRKHVQAFDSLLSSQTESLDQPSRDDLGRRLDQLLVWEFEAAIALKDYESLELISEKTTLSGSLQAMADLLLRSDVPKNAVLTTMKLIVNALWALEQFDKGRLALYIRVLFQATKEFELLDVILDMAQEVSSWSALEEVEWFSITTWDRAVDFFAAGEDDQARKWAQKAMELAGMLGDGALGETLREKYTVLGL